MTEFAPPQAIEQIRQDTQNTLVQKGVIVAGEHEVYNSFLPSQWLVDAEEGLFSGDALNAIVEKASILDGFLLAETQEDRSAKREELLQSEDSDVIGLTFLADCVLSKKNHHHVPTTLSKVGEDATPLSAEGYKITRQEAISHYHDYVSTTERYKQLTESAKTSEISAGVKRAYDSLQKWPETDVVQSFIADVLPQFDKLPEVFGYFIIENSYLSVETNRLDPVHKRLAKQKIIDFVNSSEAKSVNVAPALIRLSALYGKTDFDLGNFTPDTVAESLADLDAQDQFEKARIGATQRLLSGYIKDENLPQTDHESYIYLRLINTENDLNNLKKCEDALVLTDKKYVWKFAPIGLLDNSENLDKLTGILDRFEPEQRARVVELFHYFANSTNVPHYGYINTKSDSRVNIVLADFDTLSPDSVDPLYEKMKVAQVREVSGLAYYFPEELSPFKVIELLQLDSMITIEDLRNFYVNGDILRSILKNVESESFLEDFQRIKQYGNSPFLRGSLQWDRALDFIPESARQQALSNIEHLKRLPYSQVVSYLTNIDADIDISTKEYLDTLFKIATDDRFSDLWHIQDEVKSIDTLYGYYKVSSEEQKDEASARLSEMIQDPFLSPLIQQKLYIPPLLKSVFEGSGDAETIRRKMELLSQETQYLKFFESENPIQQGFLKRTIKKVLDSEDSVAEANKYNSLAVVDASDPWRTFFEASKILVGDVESIGFQEGMKIHSIPKIVLPLGARSDESVLYDEYMHIGFARKSWGDMSVRQKRMLADLNGLDDIAVSSMQEVDFHLLRPTMKQQFLAARLYEATMFGKDREMRSLADTRNRIGSGSYEIGPDDLAHFTSVDSLNVLLPGGNLAGEVISISAKQDSYPFNVDFAGVTPKILETTSRMAQLNLFGSNNFGNKGVHGFDGRVVLHYKMDKDSVYAQEVFDGRSFNGHKLIFGGVPSTEIRAITVMSNVAINDAVNAIVENGFYIPLLDSSGELLLDPATFDVKRKEYVDRKVGSIANTTRLSIGAGQSTVELDTHNFVEQIKAKEPEIGRMFDMPAGVWEGYTLGEHVEMVLNQFEDNFAGKVEDSGILNRSEIVAMLVLHDIGKPQSKVETGSTAMQHSYTKQAIEVLGEKLGLDENKKRLVMDIASQDNLGAILNGSATTKRVVFRIKSLAKKHNIPVSQLFDVLYMYSLSDGSSYSENGRYVVNGKVVTGKKSIFESSFDRSSGLRYTGVAREKISNLCIALNISYPSHLE
jgi:hypothetical protein